MVWVRKPLRIGGGEDEFGRETAGRPVKAGLATSLGFGHVSGFVALVHPGAFEAAVAKADGEAALEAWRERANARLAAGQRHLEEGMMGRAALYEPIDNRRFRERTTVATTTTRSKRRCSSTRTPASVPTATTRPDSSGSPRLMGASSAPDLRLPSLRGAPAKRVRGVSPGAFSLAQTQ